MAQAGPQTSQNGPTERPYGQYTIRKDGNSLVVTVPRMMKLAANTTVRIRAGRRHGRVIYLKAIPLEAVFAGEPGTQTVTTTAQGDHITEETIGDYSVCDGRNKTLVVPAKCETERFPEQTAPMLVAGAAETGFVYLKIIPECLYEQAWTIAIDDLVAVSA